MRLRAATIGAVCSAATSLSLAQDPGLPQDGAWIAVGGHRQVLLLAPDTVTTDTWADALPVRTQTFATATHRVHLVEFEGETFGALTPLDGPGSKIVFDPARRTFARLLPSVRVETSDAAQLDRIVTALGATGATFFESLGFAIVRLPPALHPLEAVARLNALPGQPAASVRLPPPPVKWR